MKSATRGPSCLSSAVPRRMSRWPCEGGSPTSAIHFYAPDSWRQESPRFRGSDSAFRISANGGFQRRNRVGERLTLGGSSQKPYAIERVELFAALARWVGFSTAWGQPASQKGSAETLGSAPGEDFPLSALQIAAHERPISGTFTPNQRISFRGRGGRSANDGECRRGRAATLQVLRLNVQGLRSQSTVTNSPNQSGKMRLGRQSVSAHLRSSGHRARKRHGGNLCWPSTGSLGRVATSPSRPS